MKQIACNKSTTPTKYHTAILNRYSQATLVKVPTPDESAATTVALLRQSALRGRHMLFLLMVVETIATYEEENHFLKLRSLSTPKP